MHSVLRINELVDLICTELQACHAEASLARLAQTCRALADAPLDALWHTQNTSFNLFRILDEASWKNYMSPQCPMTQRDLDALTRYTRRIRKLICHSGSGSNVKDFVWQGPMFEALAAQPAAQGLFTNLRGLIYDLASPPGRSSRPWISPFLGPSLRSVIVPMFRKEVAVALGASDCTPNLTNLELCVENLDDTSYMSEEMLTIIPRLRDIKALTLYRLSPDSFRQLAELQHLVELQFMLPGWYNHDEPSALSCLVARTLKFAALSILSIELDEECQDWIQLRHLFHALNVPRLGGLYISSKTGLERWEILDELFTDFAQLVPARNIMELSCSVSAENAENAPRARPYSAMFLRPLFCFSELRVLDIRLPSGIDLDDRMMTDLAQAWPRVYTLRLGRVEPESTPATRELIANAPRPRTTLLGLRALSQHCIRLRELTLAVDVTLPASDSWGASSNSNEHLFPGFPPEFFEKPTPACVLDTFNAGESPIHEDPIDVAWALCAMFPILRKVTTMDDPAEPSEEDEEEAEVGMAVDDARWQVFEEYLKRWRKVEKLFESHTLLGFMHGGTRSYAELKQKLDAQSGASGTQSTA
ncbi:hypothetical protein MKEN_00141100 [Mycena kentingensis (nom. inval.)]|nr:hypothetical protein MKEN_00141100 [Mycena kentingensis (nom. inval.)]